MSLDLSPSAFEPVLKALAVAGLPAIEQTLTKAVATATLGPFSGLVSPEINLIWPSINRALGLASDTPQDQTAATIQADPAAARDKLAAVQEQHAAALAIFNAQESAGLAMAQESDRTALTGDAAQVDLDRQAAKSSSFFVYGPRPAIMWTFGAIAALYALLDPFGWMMNGLFGFRFVKAPELPWYVWLTLLGLLGLIAALRSLDKRSGTAGLPPGAPVLTSAPSSRAQAATGQP